MIEEKKACFASLCGFASLREVSFLVPYNILSLFFAISLLFAMPVAAYAHAFPDHSDPRVGSTVAVSPAMVRIWFDGDIEPVFSTLMVHTMDGRMVSEGKGQVDPKDSTLLEVSVPPLPPGQYLVIWSVIARDGHHTMGRYNFTVK